MSSSPPLILFIDDEPITKWSVTGELLVIPPAEEKGFVDGDCQEASPLTSEVSTFPAPGLPPLIFNCPSMSNFAVGFITPIPVLPLMWNLPPLKKPE
jgi:hypothetical protein